MSVLARDLYRSLADVVAKLEIDVMAAQSLRDTRYPGAPAPCTCDAMSSGPGCKPCLVRRGRAAMAEYEAANSPVIPDCSTCGKSGPDIAVSVDFEGNATAQCRDCYVAACEREMAEAAS